MKVRGVVGISQVEWGRLYGCHVYVGNIEREKHQPTVPTVTKMLDAIGWELVAQPKEKADVSIP